MTSRQFDPVFSAALRNDLEALADAQGDPGTAAPARPVQALLGRPQLWVSLVTALVLAIATIGVLQAAHPAPPAERPRIVDPLTWITDPGSSGYVAREVPVLLHVSATGPGVHELAVPKGVRDVQVYLNCAPAGSSEVGFDGDGGMRGTCSRSSGTSYGLPLSAGTHEVDVRIRKGAAYTLLVTAAPAPTVSRGALLDPLAQVRDLGNPDALTGDTTPVLRFGGSGAGAATAIDVVPGQRLRVYFVCQDTSASARVLLAGRTVEGCMNSIAHWFDLTPRSTTLTADVTAPAAERWSVLAVPAPAGAKDSPGSAVLAYPKAPGTLLARARGAGAAASGAYRRPGVAITSTVTCRGTGWLELSTGDGGTSTRGTSCSTALPQTTGIGAPKDRSLKTWRVVPHGDISWTFQLSSDG